MDKNAIKKFAIWARRELIERVSQRAAIYGITAADRGDPAAESVNGRLLTASEKNQRRVLINSIKEKGFEQVIEEVAYTWFNRFAALRFMEVNGYLPSHIRVFTNDLGEFKPQILSEAIHLDLEGLNKDKVYELEKDNKTEELFKYLLVIQCNALNSILPGMFQRIDDYTELLLPDNLLREGSVIEKLVVQGTSDSIPESEWTDQVQIIGWLYQYYNTEPKDKVFSDLKKNIKITKEKIPAATQLFTPDWIVHYMVENSLGRLWLEGHPNNSLKSEWKYYLDEAEQEESVKVELEKIRKEYAKLKPEEIKVIDPCSGSGHILCVIFDVLVRIYEDFGYTAREAVTSIVENNLYGLDIDERAAQLSYFAVMMKARQYDRRFLAKKDADGKPDIPQPHVYVIEESNSIKPEALNELGQNLTQYERDNALEQINKLIEEMYDAKEYGSLTSVSVFDWNLLRRFAKLTTDNGQMRINMHDEEQTSRKLQKLIDIGEALAQKYEVVVTNPPYMGNSGMNGKLAVWVKDNYPDSKSDLFAVFIERGRDFVIRNGFNCMVTMQSWMFLSSFEKMRNKLIQTMSISSLVHMENMVMGIAFGTAVSVFRNSHLAGYRGTYNQVKLVDIDNDAPKEFPIKGNRFAQVSTDNFSKIPGYPVAYWISSQMTAIFSHQTLSEFFISGGRNKTHNDDKYIRLLWEVPRSNKWSLYAKGGAYRKWYGDIYYVVDWTDNAKAEYASHGGLVNKSFWGKAGITWTIVTAYKASFRYKQEAVIYSSVSPTIFNSNYSLDKYTLALLNSKIAETLLDIMNPTLAYNVSNILDIPYIESDRVDIENLVQNNINISKSEWDSFETSFDFKRHPLIEINDICKVNFIRECFQKWDSICDARFSSLKENEEKINQKFIDIYGLSNELSPDIDDKDVTVCKADLQRDVKSFISYAVGCMFGRYSLDVPALVYDGGTWDPSKYIMFPADEDAILPICDDEYFEDDIVGLFIRFVEKVYGKEALEENLQFIADALGGKGTSREIIRNYFMNGFYSDHVKVYQKRPIYWLFDSGKKNGFKCLIYLHRYKPDTIARIRTDYIHEQQSRYRTAIEDLNRRIDGASPSEKVKLNKQLTKVMDQAEELRVYEEKIHHLADQMIEIDLDDGVKVNYAKFQDVLAKIK